MALVSSNTPPPPPLPALLINEVAKEFDGRWLGHVVAIIVQALVCVGGFHACPDNRRGIVGNVAVVQLWAGGVFEGHGVL